MAWCMHCGAEVKETLGIFIINHDPGCPHYKPNTTEGYTSMPQHVSSKTDKADHFAEIWPVDFHKYEREYHFHPSRKWRFDFAWPDRGVAVEVDGQAWHVKGGGKHGTDEDKEKINAAMSMGWRVFHFSPGMISKDPYGVAEIVANALDNNDLSIFYRLNKLKKELA